MNLILHKKEVVRYNVMNNGKTYNIISLNFINEQKDDRPFSLMVDTKELEADGYRVGETYLLETIIIDLNL